MCSQGREASHWTPRPGNWVSPRAKPLTRVTAGTGRTDLTACGLCLESYISIPTTPALSAPAPPNPSSSQQWRHPQDQKEVPEQDLWVLQCGVGNARARARHRAVRSGLMSGGPASDTSKTDTIFATHFYCFFINFLSHGGIYCYSH